MLLHPGRNYPGKPSARYARASGPPNLKGQPLFSSFHVFPFFKLSCYLLEFVVIVIKINIIIYVYVNSPICFNVNYFPANKTKINNMYVCSVVGTTA